MASVGHYNYVVVVLTVIGGSKASDIKLVLQRELRTSKTWFHAGSILPYEEHVDAAVRKLHEETGLSLNSDNLTLLSNYPVRVSLHERKHQLVYVFSAYVPVPFVTSNAVMLSLCKLLRPSRPSVLMLVVVPNYD
jgi:8-oxo-dGTP pyrophosphatase MutT (NUDIX family)